VSESEITMGAAHRGVSEESPYGIESKKLAMWLFIIADAATFGAILFAYGFLRIGSPDWTSPFTFSPTIVNGMIMTFVLLTSSLTMLGAVQAAKAGRKSSCLGWLGATILLGTAFAALHLREWFTMLGEGWRLFQNPAGGSPQFGATFFSITGLHLLHVISGVVAIAVIAIGFNRGRFSEAHIETTGLYWHFVDVVWMFVFPLVYLMNAK
jgi:cytochrome c oxidase subunit 3